MAYSDTIQRQYRDIIEQVRRKYPDTDELDDRIEYELHITVRVSTRLHPRVPGSKMIRCSLPE